MIRRPVRQVTEHETVLWWDFVDSYLASDRRLAVDVFLRALIGAPRG